MAANVVGHVWAAVVRELPAHGGAVALADLAQALTWISTIFATVVVLMVVCGCGQEGWGAAISDSIGRGRLCRAKRWTGTCWTATTSRCGTS
jgi:hypothetical protein